MKTRLKPLCLLGLFYVLSNSWTATGAVVLRKCCPEDKLLHSEPYRCEYTNGREGSNRTDHHWWLHEGIAKNASIPLNLSKEEVEYGDGSICSLPIAMKADRHNVSGNGVLNGRNNEQFSSDTYCADYLKLDGKNRGIFVYLVCGFKKCCDSDEVLTVDDNRCIKGEARSDWKVIAHGRGDVTINAKHFLFPLYSNNSCGLGSYEKLLLASKNNFVLETNSTVYIRYPMWERFHSSDFCVDAVLRGNNMEPVTAIVVCIPRKSKRKVSVVTWCLIVLAVVTIAIWTFQCLLPNLQSFFLKAVTCYLFSNQISCALVALIFALEPIPTSYCKLLGLLQQYTALGEMFWLNSMCIDLAWTFRTMPLPQRLSGDKSRKFFYYSLYGWGFPAFLVAVTSIIEFTPTLPDHPLRPNFDFDCWFHSLITTFLYHGIILCILVSFNVGLSVYAIWIILCEYRKSKMLSNENANIHGTRPQDKRNWSLRLCLKTIFITGMSYVVDIITWLTTSEFNLIFVIVCLVRNILILILFYWKPKMLRARLQQLGVLREASENSMPS